jgi:hypothetical protein
MVEADHGFAGGEPPGVDERAEAMSSKKIRAAAWPSPSIRAAPTNAPAELP